MVTLLRSFRALLRKLSWIVFCCDGFSIYSDSPGQKSFQGYCKPIIDNSIWARVCAAAGFWFLVSGSWFLTDHSLTGVATDRGTRNQKPETRNLPSSSCLTPSRPSNTKLVYLV